MVTVWAVIVIGACVAMIGLVLDGGAILRTQSQSYDLAAQAGRVGAQQLDQDALAEGRVRIDPVAARTAIEGFLRRRHAAGDVSIAGTTLTVTVHTTVRLQVLHGAVVHVDETASSRAIEPGA
jgi:hypothetical protein